MVAQTIWLFAKFFIQFPSVHFSPQNRSFFTLGNFISLHYPPSINLRDTKRTEKSSPGSTWNHQWRCRMAGQFSFGRNNLQFVMQWHFFCQRRTTLIFFSTSCTALHLEAPDSASVELRWWVFILKYSLLAVDILWEFNSICRGTMPLSFLSLLLLQSWSPLPCRFSLMCHQDNAWLLGISRSIINF